MSVAATLFIFCRGDSMIVRWKIESPATMPTASWCASPMACAIGSPRVQSAMVAVLMPRPFLLSACGLTKQIGLMQQSVEKSPAFGLEFDQIHFQDIGAETTPSRSEPALR